MPHPADQNLLLGVLALQMEFISSDALLDAMKAWTFEKGRSIAEILVERGELDPADRDALRPILDRHLARHGGDPARSIAALDLGTSSLEVLRTLGELEVVEDSDRTFATRSPISLDSTAILNYDPGDLPTSPRYHRVRLHARGNLGEVFVAHDKELHRHVALKQIQERNADDSSSQARFFFEAEVTGGLEHPGIVPVYGLGRYHDGRPYYAMRLIQGDSLTESIAAYHAAGSEGSRPGARMLELQKLLRRFLDVCNAVAYAHSRGILHRDLKPSNIMVGKYGETLVVDWGLARPIVPGSGPGGSLDLDEPLLQAPSGSDVSRTIAGSVVGTPAYMSPEQAAGLLDQLGPASDVYSLGATLYHILTGRPTFGSSDVLDVLHRVQQGDFPPPREVEPTVPRALDAITRKAMATRPGDRYATPLELAADLEHWLADEPISALPERRADRLARWARQHRAATLSAAATLLGIAIAATSAAFLIAVARGETRKALEARTEALVAQTRATGRMTRALDAARLANDREKAAKQAALDEAEKANSVANFLVGLFQEADPVAAAGRTFGAAGRSSEGLTALNVVDRGAKALEDQLRDRPLVRAAMLDSIGNVYVGLGATDRAEPILTEALEIRRRELPPDHLDVAASLHSLGWAKEARFDPDSVGLLRRALEIRSAKLSSDDPSVAATQFHLAIALIAGKLGTSQEIDRLLGESLATRRRRLGPSSHQVAVQLVFMAYLEAMRDEHLRAAPLFLEAAKIALQRGETRAATNLTAYVKAEGLQRIVGPERSLPAFARCIEEATRAFGEDHFVTTYFITIYADKLLRAGKPAEAEKYYRESLAHLRRVHAPDPMIASMILNVARALRDQGRASEAQKVAREALEILRGCQQSIHVKGSLSQACQVVGLLDWNLGDHGEAPIALLQEGVKLRREVFGPESPMLADTLHYLASFYAQARRDDEAIAAYEEALRIARNGPGPPPTWQERAQKTLDRLRAR
ncbi:tetratricopeptide repeat protein [Tundrisphaera lichenicola]|uniref:serine/threonine-protein kinase n=1 Tax=Tundrisphaera lichenicola TaxID=2029860 RepID=UPI003EBECE40